jgi:hypothetical protein
MVLNEFLPRDLKRSDRRADVRTRMAHGCCNRMSGNRMMVARPLVGRAARCVEFLGWWVILLVIALGTGAFDGLTLEPVIAASTCTPLPRPASEALFSSRYLQSSCSASVLDVLTPWPLRVEPSEFTIAPCSTASHGTLYAETPLFDPRVRPRMVGLVVGSELRC